MECGERQSNMTKMAIAVLESFAAGVTDSSLA